MASTVVVWLPFSLRNQMTKVFANYDGPNYIIISKCGYNPECIRTNFSLPLPVEYYAAHFPAYPLFISLFNIFLPGWWAMLAVNLIATGLMASIFYSLTKKLKANQPFWLAVILLFLPARMLILRSIGAPETLFIAAILGSIYFYRQKKYWPAGLLLAAAQTIKTPAILLFIAYAVDIFIKYKFKFKNWLPRLPLILGPAIILPIFWLHANQTGNFLAYFYSGDNFHLIPFPFQTFVSSRSWLGDFWLEDIIYIYLIGGLAISYLWKKYKTSIISIFPTIFYIATLFVAHRDISRYSSPLYPFWILAFSDLLKKEKFKIVFLILLPAFYLYAINFINYNLTPIADWTPYR